MSIKDIQFNDYKWIDARFSLKDSKLGKFNYENEHVLGAVHWDLNDDLSDMTKEDGRQPMPNKELLLELFQSSGLELEDAIAIYDDGGSPFATRAWWFLQYAGFKHAVILLEGFDALKEYGVPVTDEPTTLVRTSVMPQWNEAIYASRDFIEKTVSGETDSILIDARAAERYRGEIEPIDPVAGHIPGALNFDWEQLKKEGIFHFDEAIKEKLEQVADAEKTVTVYCGSGVTAAPVYAMLAHYGYENIRLYIGSYSDWVSREGAVVHKE